MFNQFTESFSVSELAQKVSDAVGGAEIVHLDDPRVELEEHYYRAAHTKLLDLGLLPFLLGDELLADLLSIARTHIDRLERSALEPKVLVALHVEHHLADGRAAGRRVVRRNDPLTLSGFPE